MALTLDEILKRSGGDPVIQKTLQGLGVNIQPSPVEAQQLQSVPEHVPYYLQADPSQVIERDQNPVPPMLRANPGQLPPELPKEDEAADDSEAEDAPAKAAAKIPSVKPAGEEDDYKGEAPINEAEPKKQDVLDFGSDDRSGDLAAAIAAKNNAIQDARIQRGFEQLGAGIARTTPNTSLSDDLSKHAGDSVDNFKALQDNEVNDPNSTTSQGMRAYMAKLGVPVSESASAAQLQKVMPYVFKDIEAKQAQTAKSEDQKNRLEERKEEAKFKAEYLKNQRAGIQSQRDQARQDHLDKVDTDRFDKMGKAITSEIASSRSAFGRSANNLQSIQNAKALINGELDPNQLDNRQVYESAKVLDRILSQGNPSISGTIHLTPETARGDFAKLMEYYTNKRQGAGAGDFMKTTSHTLDREETLANKQIATTQKAILGSYSDLKKRHPDMYNEIMHSHGIPVEGEASASKPLDTAPPANPRDEAALATIKKNNPGISDADAQNALMQYKQSKGH